MDIEINYDPFGRRIGDYANGTRGYGLWQTEYVPSGKPNVTYANAPGSWQSDDSFPDAPASQSAGAPDAEQSWQSENAQPDTPAGQYKGDPSASGSSEWTQYRNQMGSKRWETSNGDSPAADALYDPYGNDWYVCSIYGSGVSSYADFGVYCNCFAAVVDRHGRPYYPGLGRRMSPDSPFWKNLFDPDNLNAYNDDGGDPINNRGPKPVWLKLGDTRVKVQVWPGTYDGSPGVQMTADPQGCDKCRWAQTASRTGSGAEAEHTDTDMSGTPLYPVNGLTTNELYDFPAGPSGAAGSFRAVSSVGDVNGTTFDVKGSMTWGYHVDANGDVTPYAPRESTPAEQQQSIQILMRENPGWTIGIH